MANKIWYLAHFIGLAVPNSVGDVAHPRRGLVHPGKEEEDILVNNIVGHKDCFHKQY